MISGADDVGSTLSSANCTIAMRDTTARQQVSSIEASRLANSAARMMESFNQGLLTLDRLRNGRQQLVTVQHVNVANGGQAIVAGEVSPGVLGDGEATENERQPRTAWPVEERQSERQSRELSPMRGRRRRGPARYAPATGYEERPMSSTWWKEPRGTS